jgi:putative SOS response-associated peptidase YedK
MLHTPQTRAVTAHYCCSGTIAKPWRGVWHNEVMCGRFVQSHDPAFYADVFQTEIVKTDPLPVSYNVAPTDRVYAVVEHDGARLLGSFRWGLIPWWAKDRKIAARNINARAETVAEKPAFRDSFAKRRCLVPADGFYEWKRLPKGKLPHYIYRSDRRPLAFAGIWASWKDPESGERIRSCSIITGKPNSLVAGIHDRMPVILGEENWETWLDREVEERAELDRLLAVFPADSMVEHPVSTLVNKVANNYPDCIVPLETPVADL